MVWRTAIPPVLPATVQRIRRRWRLARLFVLLLMAALLLSGCPFRSTQTPRVELTLNDFLPPEWQPLGALQEINIDGDAGIEYLLLYTYDQAGGSGPVGALILDPQSESVVTESNQRLAGRPAGFPNLYGVLPSYWKGAGQGFVAAPGQQEAISARQVAYLGAAQAGQAAPADALIIRGGETYLTFVWWRNVTNGYGLSQLYAPGGFEGVDWDAWAQTPAPVYSVTGVEPRWDRSLICHKTRYDLAENPALASEDFRQPIYFLAVDLGLHFCADPPPAHPFYPEGVVLAYLRHPDLRPGLLIPTLRIDEAEQTRLTQLIGLENLVRVDEVLGYRSVAVPTVNPTLPESQPLMSVCAQITLNNGTGEDALEPRWLLFTLDHQPPLLDPPTPDRLFIRSVHVIPAPASGVGIQCDQLISEQ